MCIISVIAYSSLLHCEFEDSLRLGCEVLLDDSCTTDLNNNDFFHQVIFTLFNFISSCVKKADKKLYTKNRKKSYLNVNYIENYIVLDGDQMILYLSCF